MDAILVAFGLFDTALKKWALEKASRLRVKIREAPRNAGCEEPPKSRNLNG